MRVGTKGSPGWVDGRPKVAKKGNRWFLLDSDGFLLDMKESPAEIRRARRIWWLFLTCEDGERAWDILAGKVYVK